MPQVNTNTLKSQDKRLADYLKEGHSIHVFDPAKRKLKIGYLNSRISQLISLNLPIKKKRIKAKNVDGEWVSVVQYSM